MSLTHAIGNITGSASTSLRVPIHVWDDAFADVDAGDAVDHALSVAPATVLSMYPTDDPGVTQVAGHIVLVEVEYTPPDIRPRDPPPTPETGTMVRRANFQAQGKHVYCPIEPIAVYAEDLGDVTDNWPNTKWCVNAPLNGFDASKNLGLTVDPLPEVFALDFYAPNTAITKSYLDTVADLCGKGAFNDATWNDYPQGSLQIVRFSLAERTPDDWEVSFGFGYAPPRTNVQVGPGIILPTMRGSWIHWERYYEQFDDESNILELVPYVSFVQRVWDEEDFDLLDLPAM